MLMNRTSDVLCKKETCIMQFISLNTNSYAFWVQNKLKAGFGWSTGLGVRRLVFPLQGAAGLLHGSGMSLTARAAAGFEHRWAEPCNAKITPCLVDKSWWFWQGRIPSLSASGSLLCQGSVSQAGVMEIALLMEPQTEDPQPKLPPSFGPAQPAPGGSKWQKLAINTSGGCNFLY